MNRFCRAALSPTTTIDWERAFVVVTEDETVIVESSSAPREMFMIHGFVICIVQK